MLIHSIRGMQDCFRQHPDVYGSELDEEEVEGELAARDGEKGDLTPGNAASPVSAEPSGAETTSAPTMASVGSSNPQGEKVAEHKPEHQPDHPDAVQDKTNRSLAARDQVQAQHGAQSESDAVIPKASHDAR